jgi:hypothetical protein
MSPQLRSVFILLLIACGAPQLMAQQITGFSPIFGSPGGPNSVIINGSGFVNGSTVVKFNNTPAQGVSVTGGGTIQCFVTASTPLGASPIQVIVGGGSPVFSLTNFTVICNGCPFVSDFSPTNSSPVTFNGKGLMAANAIFAGGGAGAIVSRADLILQVNTPAGVQSGPVAITNGVGIFTNNLLFYAPPVFRTLSTNVGRTLTNVTMLGTNFLGATSVSFLTNGSPIPAAYTALSNNAVSIIVPTNAVTGPIRLIAPAGFVQSGTFTVPPTLLSFSPTNGNVGTNVTLTGLNLNGGTPTVKFGGITAGTPSAVSFTQVTVQVPALATNSFISITTTDGVATATSLFYMPPSISSFTPTNTLSSSIVKLTGLNFTGASAVTFNGAPAQNFWVTNNTTIGAAIPVGVSSGFIAVTTPGGTATSSAKFYAPPLINGFNPTSGLPGTNVTITGTNLLDASAVLFNGLASTSITPVDNGTVRATVPTSAQTGPITVVTPGGTNVSASNFVLNYTNDIVVTGTVTPEPVAVGSNLLYTLTVLNSSPFNAANVLFTNTLPDSVKLSSFGITVGSLNTSGNPLLGNIGTLGPNATSVITLTVVPQSGGFITNQASAGGGFNDPSLANNVTNLVSTVLPRLRAFRTKTNTVVFGWPAPSTGFNLQQNGSLGTTNWTPVTNVPVPVLVTNAVTTNENQVTIMPRTNSVFRLKYP